MVKYILRRLTVDVNSELDRTKELRISLLPITADDAGIVCDIICDMPVTLHPVKANFTKLASATKILRAQHLLNADREKLVHALHLAELLSTVADNFSLIVEAKCRLEETMLSQPRLRWIKAINQVLVLNYVEKVKTRLLRSNCAAWYQSCVDTEQRRVDALVPMVDRRRSPSRHSLPGIDGLDPMERRRQFKAERLESIPSTPKSSSFNGEGTKTPMPNLLKQCSRPKLGNTPKASSFNAPLKKLVGSPNTTTPKSSSIRVDKGKGSSKGNLSKKVTKVLTDKAPTLMESYSEILTETVIVASQTASYKWFLQQALKAK
ncbi:hypothetical protein B484DRAFT_406589 [Ochromonadaceae sp. CCMP2298]|nr:hypothetical protein B484DRAFT_406589 [Ochromonadaceae sp. CCMP2298]